MIKKILAVVFLILANNIFAQINFNPIQIEPPKFISSTEVLKQMRENSECIRELRENDRKYAIEKAIRESITSNGKIDTIIVIKSLIKSGFGEDVPRILKVLREN